MRLRSPSTKPARRMARPAVPALPYPPRAARIASGALLFLAAYGALALLTYADLLVRLAEAILAGGTLPTWALIGFLSAAAVLSSGSILTRGAWRAAQYVRDQDPRASVGIAIPVLLLATVHATLVTGPLSRWDQAAPVIGAPLLGDIAVLLLPLAVLAALLATVARRQADAWLNALPD